MYRPFLLVVHFISSCIFGSSKKSVYHLYFGLLTKISYIYIYRRRYVYIIIGVPGPPQWYSHPHATSTCTGSTTKTNTISRTNSVSTNNS